MKHLLRLHPFYAVLAAATAAMWLFLQFRPLHDTDIFWQVKLGELMWQQGGLVVAEPFSAPHEGEALVPLSWLCQLLYAAVQGWGGWLLLHRVDALLWVAGLAVGGGAMRRDASAPAMGMALALAFLAAFPFASVRPQSWAVLAFGLYLALVRSSWPGTWKVAAAVPLLVLWQNLHPSVTVAGMGTGMLALYQTARFLGGRDEFPWTNVVLTGLALLASLATPAGFAVFEVAAYNARASQRLEIGEWLPLWAPANFRAAHTAWLAIAFTALLWLWRRQPIPWNDFFFALPYLLLALAMYRFVLFWAVAMIPIWARLLDPTPLPLRPGARLATGLFAAIMLVVAGLIPWFLQPPLFIDHLPMAALAKLHEAKVEGVIYNNPGWGGPLIHAGFPLWRVVYDGRYYVYPEADWIRCKAAQNGEIPLVDLLKRHQPAAFFLCPGEEDRLIEQVRVHPEWRELHRERTAIVFVPHP